MPFWSGWASHKFKKPGVRYEIGIAIHSADIVWVNGPFPAGKFADTAIFCRELKQLLEMEREWAEADDGYRGEPLTIELPNEGCYFGGEKQKKLKKKVRSRHETVNGRLKEFGCLDQIFRHKRNRHKLCFDAVVVLTQIAIKTGEINVFSVKNYKTQTLYQRR